MSSRIEPLGGGLDITVSSEHRFGTDAVLLADFSAPKAGDTACDLGTGCGIIPMLWFKQGKIKNAAGVELQPEAAALCSQTIARHNLQDRLEIWNGDLKEVKNRFSAGSFDLVTCNPPYKAEGAGLQNPEQAHKIARHETACTFADVAAAAAWLLRFGGRFCICQRPERLCDLLCEMREAKIEPKRVRFVAQKAGQEPWLVLIEGRAGGNPGLRVLPTLIVEQEGRFTDEMLKIYGDYKQGHSQKI